MKKSMYERAYDRDSLVRFVRENPEQVKACFPRVTSGLCRGWCPVLDCDLNVGKGKFLLEPVPEIRFKKHN